MSRAERPDMTEALQDLSESTRNAAVDVGSSMGAVVTAAVLGGHAAVKNAGASVAGTATGAANTAGSGMKSSSTAALGTVSATVSGAANRARGAVGGTIETMIDKAHSATGGSREQLAVAIQNRRAEKKATTRSAQIAARAAALKAAKSRIDEMNERLVSRRASSVTELRDGDRNIDGDIDGDVDFSDDSDSDRDIDVSDSLLTDASPADGQADESTIEVVTREPATDEPDGEQASVRRRRRVSRREKAAIVASLFEGSEVGDQSDKKSKKKSKKRSGSAFKLALLVAIAGAVAAAVRALRPSSSSTGASIPPKMRPVPDSRSAATTPASTTTSPGAVVVTDTVPNADTSAFDSSVDTTFTADSDAAASTTTFGSDVHTAGTAGIGTSGVGTSDVGFSDAFAAADGDGEPQQTVLADAPEPEDEVVYSTETEHEGRHEQH